MIGMYILWPRVIFLLPLLAVPAIIAGVACLAVGLAQHKKKLWVTGAVLLAAPLALLVLAGLTVFLITVVG
jgi:hypothetical protein